MNRTLYTAIGLLTLIAATFAYLWATAPTPTDTYIDRRLDILTKASERTPAGMTLLIGDSISERSGMETLCGSPVFNAGVSAATLGQVQDRAIAIADTLDPKLTIVALGANDARLGNDLAEWEAAFGNLLDALPRPLLVVSLPDLENTERAAFVAPFNAAIDRQAKARNLPLVAPVRYDVSDGMHQSPAGAVTWRDALAAKACAM